MHMQRYCISAKHGAYISLHHLEELLQSKFGSLHFAIRKVDGYVSYVAPEGLSENDVRTLLRRDNIVRENGVWRAKNERNPPESGFPDIPVLNSSLNQCFETQSVLRNGSLSSKQKYKFRGSFYEAKVYVGQTSEVFDVAAQMEWSSLKKGKVERTCGSLTKVAIKRLDPHISQEQFLIEYEALKNVSTIEHPNIVEIIGAFECSIYPKSFQYFNFAFPLALGNLKRLFRGEYAQDWRITSKIGNLWTQFAGLSSALAYMHETLRTAHRDIKPSNILLYESELGTLILKITDFGLSVDLTKAIQWELGTREARSAWNYDAPEVRNAQESGKASLPTPSQVLSNDIWKLGCVFAELETFLSRQGPDGLKAFRSFIRKTQGDIESDDITDSRFDDGAKVKDEVITWLQDLKHVDQRCSQLSPIVCCMLDSAIRRPTARQICERVIASDVAQKFWFDGSRRVQLLPPKSFAISSLFDRLRLAMEVRSGSNIDWRPLPPLDPPYPPSYLKVSWNWKGCHLFVLLSPEEAHMYRRRCVPLLSGESDILALPSPAESSTKAHVSGSSQLPTHITSNDQQEQTTTYWSRTKATSQVMRNTFLTWLRRLFSWFTRSGRRTRLNAHTSVQCSKEVFWCVDKAWVEPQTTMVCSVFPVDMFDDDAELYDKLSREYGRIRGWLHTIFSWKTCTSIDFVKFYVVWKGKDEVLPTELGVPPSQPPYEHRISADEMKIVSKELVAGMMEPDLGIDDRDTIAKIPKRDRPPTLLRERHETAWGLHARQGFSLRKILIWMVCIQALGLLFVGLWLGLVNNTDLQNAFVPVTFMTTLFIIGLGVPQALGAA